MVERLVPILLLLTTAHAGDPVPRPSKTVGPKARGRAAAVTKVSIPGKNHAFWLGYGGSVDTDIDLDDFAHGDFTLTLWAQPQYQYGGAGPMVGENGSGRFFIGQGDYRSGRFVFGKKSGQPMLLIAFGSRKALFEVPEVADNDWVHLAVVRKGNTISLYVNGTKRDVFRKKRSDPTSLEVVPGDSKTPHGTLRVGRRTAAGGQFYGFVDDIGIFKTALGPRRIANLATASRLRGNEKQLWRGIGFDKGALGDLPVRLRTQLSPQGAAKRYKVSKSRSRTDRTVWDMPFHLAAMFDEPLQLPFAKNEVWKVVQGMNSKSGSHNGGRAFASIDFVRVGAAKCTDGTVYASTSGQVINYKKDDDPPLDKNEANFVHLRRSGHLGQTYMHFGYEGLAAKISGGTPHPKYSHWKTLSPGNEIPVKRGEYLGHIGAAGCHLHIGAWDSPLGDRIPYPYADFEVSHDKGKTWTPVLRGIPRAGMWVRRTGR